jgi:hypothetical protein
MFPEPNDHPRCFGKSGDLIYSFVPLVGSLALQLRRNVTALKASP